MCSTQIESIDWQGSSNCCKTGGRGSQIHVHILKDFQEENKQTEHQTKLPDERVILGTLTRSNALARLLSRVAVKKAK